MGWLFCAYSKDDLIAELRRDLKPERDDDLSVVGNVMYCVQAMAEPSDERGHRSIAVIRLSCDSSQYRCDEYKWGYKVMDESMMPYYFSCPERILARSDCKVGDAEAWREKCREVRRTTLQRSKISRALKPGVYQLTPRPGSEAWHEQYGRTLHGKTGCFGFDGVKWGALDAEGKLYAHIRGARRGWAKDMNPVWVCGLR